METEEQQKSNKERGKKTVIVEGIQGDLFC